MTQKPKQDIRQPLRAVIVGHVDHGKSTLIGRLLYDTDSLPPGKKDELEKISARRGAETVEWSFVLDAFQAERDQNITIDTTQIWLRTHTRDVVIIDAPGHREFLKNMISGAAAADAAFLVVDAGEGVQEQTRRHAYLLNLLGLRQVAVVINKMDSVDYDEAAFKKLSAEVTAYLSSIGVKPDVIIPISARHGDMIAARGDKMPWYKGKTVTETIEDFKPAQPDSAGPLRFFVQDVYRFDDKKKERIIVGRVESGVIRKGDAVLLSPTGEEATVTSIETWPEQPFKTSASAGEAVGITLDQKIFVERGHVASHKDQAPVLSQVFAANIFWLSAQPLTAGKAYKIRIGTQEAMATLESIVRVIDTQDLSTGDGHTVGKNMVARVIFRARDVLPFDNYKDIHQAGRVVIYDGYDVAGGGTVDMTGIADMRAAMQPKSQNLFAVDHLLDTGTRAQQKGHRGGVFWLTGYSGAGKSTLAMMLEKMLFNRGYHAYVLDGDNVRRGLNADLGFSAEDRAENIRRVGEIAALMADAGLIVITAFISPFAADRARARAAAGGAFHEIYIATDLETCETRDTKGLYKKARAGEIADFTGISSPYEPPLSPELVIDTRAATAEDCARRIEQYIQSAVALSSKREKKL